MLTIETLKEFGADTAQGVSRCMNMTDFYLNMVKKAAEDEKLYELKQAIEEDNKDKAFEIAHALKGVYGNLSLTPLYKPVSEMTELLRSRTDTDYGPLMEEALTKYKEFKDLL